MMTCGAVTESLEIVPHTHTWFDMEPKQMLFFSVVSSSMCVRFRPCNHADALNFGHFQKGTLKLVSIQIRKAINVHSTMHVSGVILEW